MFNLVQSAWLPVRRLSGARETVAPHQITERFSEDPVMALEFGRADFDGAIAEFLIGLLAVARPPEKTREDDAEEAWAKAWETPPSPAKLEAAFAPLAFAFNLDGDGPRCFQDIDSLGDDTLIALNQLLIEAPGANTLRNNGDLFQKRGSAPDFTPGFTAAALITLQTYAPSGGAGHRTSMRGGGPLTTLAVTSRPAPAGVGERITTLWDRLWPNVPSRSGKAPVLDEKLFAWLGKTRTSEKGQVCTGEQMQSLHCFFGMPRRIRLVFSAEGVPEGYRSRNYGMNYEEWTHPLSPYYKSKDNKLPIHPRAGPASYRDWLGVLVGYSEGDSPAQALGEMSVRIAILPREHRDHMRVEAFGYDMDNMKARGWVNQTIPFFTVPDARREALASNLRMAVSSADAMAYTIRNAIRIAFFGERGTDGRVSVRSAGGETATDAAHDFWAQSEPAFRAFAGAITREDATTETDPQQRRIFFDEATAIAQRVFERHVDMEAVIADKPWRYPASLRALNIGLSPRNSQKNSAFGVLGFTPEKKAAEKEAADVSQ